MSLLSRLEVLSEVLGNVFDEMAKEAAKLFDDLEGWHMPHEHTPKTKEVQRIKPGAPNGW